MTRSVFYGFGAFVGSITGPTTCAWWADDPARLGWDPSQLTTVDLSKTPEAYRQQLIRIDEIQVDDHGDYDGAGHTQIGPMWPGGTMSGGCWLEASYWQDTLGGKPDRQVPGWQGHLYELCIAIDWDADPEGRRFNGYHAEIVGSPTGSLVQVKVWNPGTSLIPGMPPAGTWWIDLARHTLPIETGFTEIGSGASDPKAGALFIDAEVADAMPLAWPKLPVGWGSRPEDREDDSQS